MSSPAICVLIKDSHVAAVLAFLGGPLATEVTSALVAASGDVGCSRRQTAFALRSTIDCMGQSKRSIRTSDGAVVTLQHEALHIGFTAFVTATPWRSRSHFERRLSNAQFPSMPRSHVGYSETPYRHIFRSKNETPKVEVGRT